MWNLFFFELCPFGLWRSHKLNILREVLAFLVKTLVVKTAKKKEKLREDFTYFSKPLVVPSVNI